MNENNDELTFTPQYENPDSNECQYEEAEYEQGLIKVIGIGGEGNNAVNHMVKMLINGVEYAAIDADMHVLARTKLSADAKLRLGTDGRGAGTDPAVSRKYAEDQKEEIKKLIGEKAQMLFIAAGMGKGTGTGAAPVVAQIAREMNLLTVAIVTYPYDSEGPSYKEKADTGIAELRKYVDSLILVQNEKILKEYEELSLIKAYAMANDVLGNAVKCISDIISITSFQNVDFNDVQDTMRTSGEAMLGIAEAEGENRIEDVIRKALTCPLIDDVNIKNAKACLFFLTASEEHFPSGKEVDKLNDEIKTFIDKDAKVIRSFGIDDSLGEKVKISIIVTRYINQQVDDFNPLKDHLQVAQPVVKPQVKDLTPDSLFDYDEATKQQAEQQAFQKSQQQAQYVAPALQPAPPAPVAPQAVQPVQPAQPMRPAQPAPQQNPAQQSTSDMFIPGIHFSDEGQNPLYDDKKTFEDFVSTPAIERQQMAQERATLIESAVPKLPKADYSDGFLFGVIPSVD